MSLHRLTIKALWKFPERLGKLGWALVCPQDNTDTIRALKYQWLMFPAPHCRGTAAGLLFVSSREDSGPCLAWRPGAPSAFPKSWGLAFTAMCPTSPNGLRDRYTFTPSSWTDSKDEQRRGQRHQRKQGLGCGALPADGCSEKHSLDAGTGMLGSALHMSMLVSGSCYSALLFFLFQVRWKSFFLKKQQS